MILKKIFLSGLFERSYWFWAQNAAAVRTFGGGYPSLLSPYHLTTKLEALGRLMLHHITHPFRADVSRGATTELIRTKAKSRGLLQTSYWQ